jgi:hypothetical protein
VGVGVNLNVNAALLSSYVVAHVPAHGSAEVTEKVMSRNSQQVLAR